MSSFLLLSVYCLVGERRGARKFPHVFVRGSCFWLCTPVRSSRFPPPAASLHNLLTHTQHSHTQLTHTQLTHTQTHTHTTYAHTTYEHTRRHTHTCSETSYRITDVECIERAQTLRLNLTGEMKIYIYGTMVATSCDLNAPRCATTVPQVRLHGSRGGVFVGHRPPRDPGDPLQN